MTFLKIEQVNEFPCQVQSLRVSMVIDEDRTVKIDSGFKQLDGEYDVKGSGKPVFTVSVQREDVGLQETESNFPVKNIEEAEKVFFEQIKDLPVEVFSKGQMKLATDEGYYPLAIFLNKAANLVAQRTRRGAGNVIVIHPNNRSLLPDGLVNGVMEVFESEHCPENKAVTIFYENPASKIKLDAIRLVKNKEDMVLFLLPLSDDALGYWIDYVGVVEIVE